ncbi:accessory Sec system S-layer assembly protein [Paenisporosarcina indica]|uniref:accessory Sec system S-layer assembly protein n=1 Tax=Paenisporosarcina indica TaxID=650093 RepID=UPI00095003F0|nr:accessory Sec system S-layer assembly protein [Paenisporosarcina indica]
MGLFSFFNKTKKTGTDSTVQSNELIQDVSNESLESSVETTLSYHPEWDVPKEQQYVFSFLSNELPPLKQDQISLSGFEIDEDGQSGEWLVKAFFRSSLNKPITLGKVELILLSDTDNVVAAKEFDLAELGEIPARSDRPWIFAFEKETHIVSDMPVEGWKIAFNVQSLVPHQVDLDPAWEEALSQEQKEELSKLVTSLPSLKEREVNFSGFQVIPQESGDLAVSLFIRNGHSRHINLEQLPLEVLDASGEIVARGSFSLDNLEVKANTSKPWTFIFPSQMITKVNPDLSRWAVKVIQE